MHIGGVGKVLVGCGNVDVFSSKYGLSNVERRLYIGGGHGEWKIGDKR